MLFFHIILLALIQGITEFLPISSSGHLVLAHEIIGKTQHDLTIDVAVHVGTLFAVFVYFKKDITKMLCSLKSGGDKNLVFAIIIGSLPVIAAGYIIHLTGPEWTRSLYLTAWCTLIFGIVLWIADKYSKTEKKIESISLKQAFIIGLAQVLALIPGTSRSGITMTAARGLGFTRTESARFSLLLAMVAISGAGTLGTIDIIQQGNISLGIDVFIAAIMAFLSGLLAITLMMKWLEKASFAPFIIYRIILGIVLLFLLYSGSLEAIPVP